jgi:integrase
MTASLRQAADDYLKIRRALGYKLRRTSQLLPKFVDFLEKHGASFITMRLAVQWATLPKDVSRRWWGERLVIVRQFARYLSSLDPRTQIPPIRMLPCPTQRAKPYVYCDEEITRILAVAHNLQGLLRNSTYATLIGLLASSGMRIGEAISLNREDVDWQHQLLLVRTSKFGKSREIILHPTTVQALKKYARERDRSFPRPRSPSFFLSVRGTRLSDSAVHQSFRQLLDLAQIRRVGRGPRLHDLRHTFAVKTLLAWYREGLDVQRRLPLLSTFLGHVGPTSTYWYLTAVPELLELASKRLEHPKESLP